MSRLTIVACSLLLFSHLVCGQEKINLYITKEGKRYSQSQRDSIEKLGNFVGIKDSRETLDTVYYSIFYYDKSFLLTPFQKKHLGKKFIQIRLKSPDGRWIDTNQMEGKILMVLFWSTGLSWEEVSQLNQLVDEFKDQVRFVSVSIDSESVMLQALSAFQFKFEVAAEGDKICSELGVVSYPTVFITNRLGVIKEVAEGVPVKTNQDRTFDNPESEIRFIIYETYSKILRNLIQKQPK